MGFTELLTIVFVILKATGYLHWPWWQVFIPEYIAAGIWVVVVLMFLAVPGALRRYGRRQRRTGRW